MLRRQRIAEGPPFGGFDELCGVLFFFIRAALQAADFVDPVIYQSEFAVAYHELVPETGPGMAETVAVVAVRQRDDGGDEQQAARAPHDAEPLPPPFGIVSAQERIADGEADRGKHDPKVPEPDRAADARSEAVEVAHHQVRRQRHDVAVVSVVPDVREQVKVGQRDPEQHPPFFVQEPDGQRQQHGVGESPEPDDEQVRMRDFPDAVRGRQRGIEGQRQQQVDRRPE